MAETKRYTGGCKCRAVEYEVDLALDKVFACNCSMCKPAGTLLAFVTPDQFHLKNGEDKLSSYKFNTQHIDHLFCATCGIKSFARGTRADGTPMVAINARCLDGVDPWALEVVHVDGASR